MVLPDGDGIGCRVTLWASLLYNCCKLQLLQAHNVTENRNRVVQQDMDGRHSPESKDGARVVSSEEGARGPESRWMRQYVAEKPNFQTPSQGGSRPVGDVVAGQTRAVAAAQRPAFCGPVGAGAETVSPAVSGSRVGSARRRGSLCTSQTKCETL